MRRHPRSPVFPALLVSIAAALAAAAPSQAAGSCTKYASPGGSDAATGTEAAPFATAQKLADSLSAGDVGCLRAGTYNENLKVSRGGAPGAPVTIRSYPGELATVVGRMWIAQGADYVTISYMNLVGTNPSNLPSPTVNATDGVFDHVDVSNRNTAICFNLGSSTWGRAVRTVIQNSRIHNCGVLPATNQDHGIYLSDTTDVVIRGNVIYDNADRGIQLYPDAQRTTITGNIIDGNGEGVIFSGAGGIASNDNVVRGNVITNSKIRHNVESWYPAGNPIGTGNVVSDNCGWGAGANGGFASYEGYTVSGTTVADPQYVNPAAGDFRLRTGSPCETILGSVMDPAVAAGAANAASPVPAAVTSAPPAAPAPPAPAPASAPAPAPRTQPAPSARASSTPPASAAAPASPAPAAPARSAPSRSRGPIASIAVVPRSCLPLLRSRGRALAASRTVAAVRAKRLLRSRALRGPRRAAAGRCLTVLRVQARARARARAIARVKARAMARARSARHH